MSFKENLLQKMKIDQLTKKVLASIGPLESGRKVDKEGMRRLLEMKPCDFRQERGLDLYILGTDEGGEKILVLDNELPIYKTTVEDVAMRKSPTVKEMLNIRNVIKILNDSDVIVSKKEASVETIRKESIDRLDLSFTEADLDSIEKDAVNALERGDADAVIESLALFVELLGYKAPPKAFETGNAKVWGALEKKETGELVFGPIVIYNLVVNTLHLMPQQIGSRDKESIELVHQVSLGNEKAPLEGPDVLDYLKKIIIKQGTWGAI